MSARRMPCKRCHHPKPVGADGYCSGCAEILRRMKLPKSAPPPESIDDREGITDESEKLVPGVYAEEILAEGKISLPDGANKMDAPGGPQCACGKPSAFEDGSCVDCAVDGAKRVEDWADKLAGDLVDAGEVERDTLAAGAHEGDPITERSSKVPTLPPNEEGGLTVGASPQGMWPPGFVPSKVEGEVVTYVRDPLTAEGAVATIGATPPQFPPTGVVAETTTWEAKNGDPDLAVLVSTPSGAQLKDIGAQIRSNAEARNHIEFGELGGHIDTMFGALSSLSTADEEEAPDSMLGDEA